MTYRNEVINATEEIDETILNLVRDLSHVTRMNKLCREEAENTETGYQGRELQGLDSAIKDLSGDVAILKDQFKKTGF